MERVATRDSALSPVKMMSHRFVVHVGGRGRWGRLIIVRTTWTPMNMKRHHQRENCRHSERQLSPHHKPQTPPIRKAKGATDTRDCGKIVAHTVVSPSATLRGHVTPVTNKHILNSAVPFICPDCSASPLELHWTTFLLYRCSLAQADWFTAWKLVWCPGLRVSFQGAAASRRRQNHLCAQLERSRPCKRHDDQHGIT